MTWFLLNFTWNWLLIPFAIWFARGAWLAFTKPRLVYKSHVKVGAESYLLTVRRQEILPMWRSLVETWHVVDCRSANDYPSTREGDAATVNYYPSTREGDGATVNYYNVLHNRLRGCLRVALLREVETAEMLKDDL